MLAIFCDPGGTRTLDPMIKSHLLYQLSYGVILIPFVFVRWLCSENVCKGRAIFLIGKFFSNFFSKKGKKTIFLCFMGVLDTQNAFLVNSFESFFCVNI